MKKYDIAVLDFETMNNNSDSPCEIGISLIKDLKIVDEYHSYINPPNNEYNLQNAKIHKISRECIAKAPEFEHVYNDIKTLILNSHIVIAHNAHFDVSVLKSTIEKSNLPSIEYMYLDSINIIKNYINSKKVNLETLCDLYNIDKRNLHSALNDAQALSKIMISIAESRNYNSILELIQNMKNQYLKFSSLTKVQQAITFAFPKKSDLKTSEINKIPVEIDDNSFFRNKAVVFTGDFEIGKDELKIIVRKNGAFIRNDVSPRIDILVEGIQQERFKDENGLVSKQRKARNLINQGSNIQIINEVELLNLVKEVEI